MKSAKEILKDSWVLLKGHYKMYLALIFTPPALNLAMQYVVGPIVLMIGGALYAAGQDSEVVKMIILVLGAVMFIFYTLVFIAIGTAGKIAIPFVSNEYDKNNNIDFVTIWKESFKKVISYLWVGFQMLGAIIIGLLALIIPGLVFSVWFMFAPMAMVIDNKKGVQALVFSKKLIEGRVWSVLLKSLYPLLVFFVFIIGIILFGFIVFLIAQKIKLLALLLSIPMFLFFILGVVCLSALAMIYHYRLYRELVDSVEVLDVSDEAIAGVGVVTHGSQWVPVWLKRTVTAGMILLLLIPLIVIGIVSSNPELRESVINGFKEGVQEGKNRTNNSEGIIGTNNESGQDSGQDFTAKDGKYQGFGLKFNYPEESGWKLVGRGNQDSSFAYFADINTVITGEHGSHRSVIDINGYELDPDSEQKDIYELADMAFTPVMQDMQAKGTIENYTLVKETIGNHEVGKINFIENTPEGKVVVQGLIVKHNNSIYGFMGTAMEEYRDGMNNTQRKMIESLEFTN